jgi:hypothetical protein
MSGATAAHASYNGSGTQGLAVTNKINDTGDIMSVFWTKDKTTKQLLHGSALIEIPSTGGTETPGSNLTFTMNSDMDVIGDLYVYATLTFGSNTNITKEYGLLNLFERIEFQCGTQIWQTLEFADILALNTTELSEGGYENFILSAGGFFDLSGVVGIGSTGTIDLTAEQNSTRAFSFRLPMLTRKLGPMLNNYSNISESGFLTAAAPNQTVKIKIYTNRTATMVANAMISASSTADRMNVRLYGKHMIMCNEEREKIRSIPGGIAKRLKLTQYRDVINPTITQTTVANTGGLCTVELDCDHFSLYASHIIIQIFDNTAYNAESDNFKLGGISTTDFNDECCTLISADLKLNSTSFCGLLTGGMMSGPLPESMGLYVNNFNSRTDPHTRTIVYVFPLANKAFSGSGVPLNRFDNIRLALRIYVPEQASASNANAEIRRISATCVGETTALYKQGAASISMY